LTNTRFELLVPTGFPAPEEIPASASFHIHHRMESLVEGYGPDSGAILLGGFQPSESLAFLEVIRSKPSLSGALVYLDRAPEGRAIALVDGIWPAWSRLSELVSEHMLLRTLVPAGSKDPEELLLQHLFAKPGSLVLPIVDPGRASLYSWPLLDCLLPEGTDPLSWRESLISRGLLRERTLVDRVRMCPSCRSGHLVFQERCPSCESIDLQREEFIHCFPCGAVGTIAEFRDPSGLRCPKCRTTLRHIGTDYDHPLDTQRCRACGNVFGQASVAARCLDCGSSSAPSALVVNDIAELEITDAGRMAVRNGTLRDIHAVFDKERYAPAAQFEQNLQWLCDMGARYGSPVFCLLQLRIRNATELADRLGRPAMIVRLEEFARRLRTILRDTDIPTRFRDDQVTILMPHTDSEKAKLAVSRLGRLPEDVDFGEGTDKLEVEWVLEAVSENGGLRDGATAVLARLSASTATTVRVR
jgi:GGDEF domain-containing protein